MHTVTPPSDSEPSRRPAACPGPMPGPHPSEYLPPARLAEWYADLEYHAALRGLPPLPVPR